MCVGPQSELHMTATTPQAVARVSEYLSRQRERERKSASRSCGGSGDDRERERERRPPSLSFCAVNLRHSDQESSANAVATIFRALDDASSSSRGATDMDGDADADADAGDVGGGAAAAGGGYLAIVTTQASLQELQRLQKQKQAVIKSAGASAFIWGHEQERELLQAAKCANRAQICFVSR